MLTQAEIAARLRQAGAMLRFRGESPHRARAYEQGASAVEAITGGLDRLIEEGHLIDVPGIGRSLAATITELVRDGRAQALERIMDDELPPALLALTDVPGFTPRRIRRLHEALDVATPDDVEAALQSAPRPSCAASARGRSTGCSPRSRARNRRPRSRASSRRRSGLSGSSPTSR